MSYAGDLSPLQAWELLGSDSEAVLVDVRSEPEWVFVGIPDLSSLGKRPVLVSWSSWPSGARNSHFLEQLATAGVTGTGPVLFLCRSGVRSQAAAVTATAAGISPAYNISEGFEGDLDGEHRRGRTGWRVHGLPWRQS